MSKCQWALILDLVKGDDGHSFIPVKKHHTCCLLAEAAAFDLFCEKMALSGVLHLGSVGNCCSQQPAKLHGHTLKTNRFLRCGSPASRGHKCCYTITLETPEGSKEITCKQSEYIFYAAEVRIIVLIGWMLLYFFLGNRLSPFFATHAIMSVLAEISMAICGAIL